MKNKRKRNLIRNFLIGIASLLVIILGIFLIWANDSYEPTEEAMKILKSENSVEVIQDEFITFIPKETKPEKGFIFYPGGKVEPEAYSALCQGIAEEGYLVVIVPMPLNLAVLSPNKAEEVIEKYSDIDIWAIGGHSLGGVMASNFATENDKIKGLALYASYPNGDSLVNTDKKIISIYGSEDGVADLEKVKGANLSEDSKLIEIKGGNHGQFGQYGHQDGDNKATISNDEQIKEAVKYTVEMLKKI